jgi:hypothetical protein
LLDGGARGTCVGYRRIALGFGDQPLLENLGGPARLALRILGRHGEAGDVGDGGRHVRFGGDDCCLEQRRIDLRDALAPLHGRVEVGKQLLDASGDLAADVDRDHGLQAAGSADTRYHVAEFGGGGLVLGGGVPAFGALVEEEKYDEDDRDKPDEAAASELFEQVRIRSDSALRAPV